MSALRQIARSRHGLTLALLAFVLAARLVPAGFMPANDGRGMTLTLCTGSGPVAIAGHAIPGGGDAPQHRQDHPCAFSGLSAALAEPSSPAGVPAPAAAPAPAVVAIAAAATVGRGLAAPPPPPTGPPALA